MTALRGVRGVIAAPFYLTIPPVVSAAFAVITALAIGMIERDTLTDITASDQWLRLAAKAWVVILGGAAAGLITGSMALQSARPTIDSDQGPSWLGRGSRAMVSGTIGGILAALALFVLRAYVGRWAAVLLVVVLVIVGLLLALVAIFRIPGERLRRSREERHDDAPIPRR